MSDESVDKRAWRNTAGIVAGNAAAEILGGVVQAQLVAILGPPGFGRLSQAIAASEVADGVAAFGLAQVGPALGSHYRDRLGAFVGTVLLLRFLASVVVILGAALIIPWVTSNDPAIVRITLIGVAFSPLAGAGMLAYFLHQENWRVAWLPGAVAVVNIGFLALVIWLAPTVYWALVAYVATRAIVGLSWTFLARRRYHLVLSFDRAIARDLLRLAPRASWLDIVTLSYTRASYFVLDGLGAAALGLYALADRIASPLLRLSGALSTTALPLFSELGRSDDPKALSGFYFRNLRRTGLMLLLGAAIAFGAVPPIIRVWFAEYEGALPILYVLYLGVCFMSVNQITSACLNGLGHFGWVAAVATLNLGVYAVGVTLFVEPYGALGAAIATTLMEGLNMLMQLGLLRRLFRQVSRDIARRRAPATPA